MSDDPAWGQPPAGQPWQAGGFGAPPPRYPGPGGPLPGYGPTPGYGPWPGYGPTGYGQPPYGQPGYGQWVAPPPAPAPGGVPLRPLAVGDILSGAFTLIRRNPAATLGIAAIVQTVYGICVAFIAWGELHAARTLTMTLNLQPGSAHATTQAYEHFFASLLAYVFLSLGLAFLFETILTGMLTGALGRGLLGDKITIAEAWRFARIGPVIGVSILVPLILVGIWLPYAFIVIILAIAKVQGLTVFVAVVGFIAAGILAIWMAIRLSLAVPAVALENIGPVAAIRRSWELVRGSWWRIFGIIVLTFIVVEVISLVLQLPFALVQSAIGGTNTLFPTLGSGTAATPSLATVVIGAIGGVAAATITRPISAGVAVLLYTDMRIRKEGLDLALHQASQRHALTGDEFASLWRPGRPSGWPSDGDAPGNPRQGWPARPGPGGYGPGGYGPGGYAPPG